MNGSSCICLSVATLHIAQWRGLSKLSRRSLRVQNHTCRRNNSQMPCRYAKAERPIAMHAIDLAKSFWVFFSGGWNPAHFDQRYFRN